MKMIALDILVDRKKIKLAAIPILLLVLVCVIAWPNGKPSQVELSPLNSLAVDTNIEPLQAVTAHKILWPEANIEEIAAFDFFKPLEKPKAIDTAAMSPTANLEDDKILTRDRIELVKVQAIYRDQRGAAAIVDSRIVRVGDSLSEGARIVEITDREVFVKWD